VQRDLERFMQRVVAHTRHVVVTVIGERD